MSIRGIYRSTGYQYRGIGPQEEPLNSGHLGENQTERSGLITGGEVIFMSFLRHIQLSVISGA